MNQTFISEYNSIVHAGVIVRKALWKHWCMHANSKLFFFPHKLFTTSKNIYVDIYVYVIWMMFLFHFFWFICIFVHIVTLNAHILNLKNIITYFRELINNWNDVENFEKQSEKKLKIIEIFILRHLL